MKKIIISFILIYIFTGICLTQEVDLKKYIKEDDWVMNLCYNHINKAEKSFTHYLRFNWDDIKYNVYVFSTNPDITVTIYDSSESRVLKKIDKYIMKDNYYFFTANFTADKTTHRVKVKATKSDDFDYYFLATYSAANSQKVSHQMINDFIDYSGELIKPIE